MIQKFVFFAIVLLVLGVVCAVFVFKQSPNYSKQLTNPSMLTITSLAFEHGKPIPKKYSCDGNGINPDIMISGVPDSAKSLVLIVDDPDAPRGLFTHWVVWNMHPQTTQIQEGSVPNDGVVGTNDGGQQNYSAPCPPSGTHRYFFKVYALDSMLDLERNAKRKDIDRAIQGHILASGELMGTYTREI